MKKYFKEILSCVLLAGGILTDHSDIPSLQHPTIRLIWYIIAFLPVGLPVLKEALEHVLKKEYFNEFMLMSLASIGAFYIGEYPEAVAVMLFYSIGELFQDRAVDNAKDNIRALLDVRPQTATVLREYQKIKEKPEKVAIGEIIEVKTGERVPLDGEMLNDIAAFNTSALTGESTPRHIRKGEEVLAGMIVTDKSIQIKVTKSYDQSALSRILELVQHAAERKAPAELFIRKFARVYTPAVTGLALLIVLLPGIYASIQPTFTFIFHDWLYRALVFLVISCPCALVVSIPLGYFGGIGAASRHGILFKGSNYLDAITKIDTIVFDKTGTLTRGVFEIQTIKPATDFQRSELMEIIASIESQSNHPIAQAIMSYAREQQINIQQGITVEEIAGHGMHAIWQDKEVFVGNLRLLESNHIDFPEELTTIQDTLIACALDGKYIGYLTLADTLKKDASEAITKLKQLNIHHFAILSGDKQTIVTQIASQLHIPHAYGDLLPEDKVRHMETIKNKQKQTVAFVGDGINDAPVLALSDLGIAMGGLGSDVAIETADVVIQTDHPSCVATAINIGKKTRQIVWQNIILALSIKICILALGAVGIATMWEAVFADVGVALLAILNAIKIQYKRFA